MVRQTGGHGVLNADGPQVKSVPLCVRGSLQSISRTFPSCCSALVSSLVHYWVVRSDACMSFRDQNARVETLAPAFSNSATSVTSLKVLCASICSSVEWEH